jgi:hypothetical protein
VEKKPIDQEKLTARRVRRCAVNVGVSDIQRPERKPRMDNKLFVKDDRVLVLGCSSRDSSDVYAIVAPFIGKCGRVIKINDDAPEVTVQFRKTRHRFRPDELSKIS